MGDELNWALGASMAFHALMLYVFFRFRSIMGKRYFSSAVKQALWRFRHPIRAVYLFKGQHWEQEIRDMETVTQSDDAMASTPVTVNEGSRYHDDSELKTYFFPQGSTVNFDPMKSLNEKFYELLKRIGLINNRYLDYKESRIKARVASQILTKDHFNKIALIGGIILIGIGYMVFNLNQFADGAKELYEEWVPILQQQLDKVPRLVPADGGPSPFSPDQLAKAINGG